MKKLILNVLLWSIIIIAISSLVYGQPADEFKYTEQNISCSPSCNYLVGFEPEMAQDRDLIPFPGSMYATALGDPTKLSYNFTGEKNITHIKLWHLGDESGSSQPFDWALYIGDVFFFGDTYDGSGTGDDHDFFNVSMTGKTMYLLIENRSTGDDFVLTEFEVNGTNITVEPPIVIVNTSLLMAKFNLSDLNFANTNFFNAFELQFNTTTLVNLSVVSAFNLLKVSGGASNEIFGRILVDDVSIVEESLRTLDSIGDEGSTGFKPTQFQVALGQHNLTLQLRRSAGGTIQINDIDFLLLEFNTLDNIAVRNQLTDDLYTHSNNDFVAGVNWSISQVIQNIFVFSKLTIQSTTTSDIFYYYQNIDNIENSTYVSRFLSDSVDIGSIGNIWAYGNGDIQNFTIQSKTSVGTITTNATILDFDMRDANNNTINFFNKSNSTSDFNTNISLTAGLHKLVEESITLINGSAFFVGAVVTFVSENGSHTPLVFINSTNESITDCYTQKDRSLSGVDDIANVYLYTECGDSLILGETYFFDLWINTTNDLSILDEVLMGFETVTFDINSLLPELNLTINSTLANTSNFNNATLQISYNFSVGLDNTLDQANCTIILNTVNNKTQIDRNATKNFLFNISFGDDVQQDFNISIQCLNSEISTVTNISLYRIDRVNPIIATDFINNTQFLTTDTLTLRTNFTDPNLFAYNNSFFDINGVETENFFAENLTTNFTINVTSRVTSSTGNFSIRLQAWDSHTGKKVRPLSWFISGDTIHFDSELELIGQIKQELTSFTLSDDETKYKFKVTFEEDSFNQTMIIKGSSNLYFLGDSKYSGHFVYLSTNKWIDFISPNIKTLEVFELSNRSHRLEITFYNKTDEIELESIGDLNTEIQIFFYTVVTETQLNTQLLTDINSTMNNINKTLTLIEGGSMILGWILWIVMFSLIAIMGKQWWVSNFASFGILMLAVTFIDRNLVSESLYNTLLGLGLIALGAVFMVATTIFTILDVMKRSEMGREKEREKHNIIDYHK